MSAIARSPALGGLTFSETTTFHFVSDHLNSYLIGSQLAPCTMTLGGAGNDRFDARSLAETVRLEGQGGNDTIFGGSGDDFLSGGDGNDVLLDGLLGALSNDRDALFGGAGNDSLTSADGVDWLDGGEGVDHATVDRSGIGTDGPIRTLTFVASLAASAGGFDLNDGLLDGTHLSNIESVNLTTGLGDDRITVDAGQSHSFDTGAGDDSLTVNTAWSGVVTWQGGSGSDTLNVDFSAAPDRAYGLTSGGQYQIGWGNTAGASFTPSLTNSVRLFGVEQLNFTGGANGNTITGLAGDDTLIGGAGGDTFDGAGGNDTLDAGAGDDTLISNAGSDRLDGGAGRDHASIGRGGLTQAMTFVASQAASAAGTDLGDGTRVANIESIALTTGSGDDRITVDAGQGYRLYGGYPDGEFFDTGAGDDSLTVNAAWSGVVTWQGGSGSDTLNVDFSAAPDRAYGFTSGGQYQIGWGNTALPFFTPR